MKDTITMDANDVHVWPGLSPAPDLGAYLCTRSGCPCEGRITLAMIGHDGDLEARVTLSPDEAEALGDRLRQLAQEQMASGGPVRDAP